MVLLHGCIQDLLNTEKGEQTMLEGQNRPDVEVPCLELTTSVAAMGCGSDLNGGCRAWSKPIQAPSHPDKVRRCQHMGLRRMGRAEWGCTRLGESEGGGTSGWFSPGRGVGLARVA